jgi:hypothetical protein
MTTNSGLQNGNDVALVPKGLEKTVEFLQEQLDSPSDYYCELVSECLAEVRRFQERYNELLTVMMAAAMEIQEHWDAHCDKDGYGPVNLMHRLEAGLTGGGYACTPKQYLELIAERDRIARRAAHLHDMLRLVLPLAKGYAYEHDVGSNQRYVDEAQAALEAEMTSDKLANPHEEVTLEELCIASSAGDLLDLHQQQRVCEALTFSERQRAVLYSVLNRVLEALVDDLASGFTDELLDAINTSIALIDKASDLSEDAKSFESNTGEKEKQKQNIYGCNNPDTCPWHGHNTGSDRRQDDSAAKLLGEGG